MRLTSVIANDSGGLGLQQCLRDASPVVRAAGMVGIAGQQGEQSVVQLWNQLSDWQRLNATWGGYSSRVVSLGMVARDLLLNSHAFEPGLPPRPVLSTERLPSLWLRVLADDQCALMHGDAGLKFLREVDGGHVALTWHSLIRNAGGLTHLQVVKAVGRLPACSAADDFLSGVLLGPAEPESTRLAAASALGRRGGPGAVESLTQASTWLDQAVGDQFTQGLLREAEAHAGLDRLFGVVAADDADTRGGVLEQVVTADHPHALQRLRLAAGRFSVIENPRLRDRLAVSLGLIADGLPQWVAPWNTWATAPYRIEAIVGSPWAGGRPPWLGRDQYLSIMVPLSQYLGYGCSLSRR